MIGPLLVLGGNGMLGHKLVQVASKDLEVYGTVRDRHAGLAAVLGVAADHLLLHPDVTVGIDDLLDRVRPTVIVNCTGALKPASGSLEPCEAISVNALVPHRIAAAARVRGMRYIHLSTDCVFEGRRGQYAEDDAPDATDLYGRSKALGEVEDEVTLTIRTSMVGRQLRGSRGLLEWFLSRRGEIVQGYRAMRFSGLSTLTLSRTIVNVIEKHPTLAGRIHMGGDAISKYDLLHIMNDTFKAGITIVPVDGPQIDRSLNSHRFTAIAGPAPSWQQMLEETAGDPTPYEEWRQRVS
ncbi:MAG: SDR family oxidoreductase [Vicinamibacterales bacterium]